STETTGSGPTPRACSVRRRSTLSGMATARAEGTPTDRLRDVQAITEAALAHLSQGDLLDKLLDRVRGILDADTAAVLMLDEGAQEVVIRAAKGLEEEVERGVRIPFGRGFAG